MVLIEAIRGGKPNGVRIVPSLIVHDTAGNYTPEVANALRND
jgi:tRNA1(Val) A37 N6-methylase TrmN6